MQKNNITIVSRDGCSLCEAAKKQLQAVNLDYTELKIGETVTRDWVLNRYPGRKMLPIIEISDSVVLPSELNKYVFGKDN